MRFEIKIEEFARLEEAMKAYQGNVTETVNEVLHSQAGKLILDEIKRLIPESGRKAWRGKAAPAKDGKSLRIIKGNLFVTVATTNPYHYLYFPDDGSNTRRHVGNQQFFPKGAENKTEEIINRCIGRLTDSFENAIN